MTSSQLLIRPAARRMLTVIAALASGVLALALVVAVSGPARAATGSLEGGSLGAQADEMLYITDAQDSGVMSVPTGGGEVTELQGDWVAPRGIALSGNTLYIANRGNQVVTAPTGGGDTADLTSVNLRGASGIALSDDGDTLYVVERLEDRVAAVSTSNGDVTRLTIPGLDSPNDVAVSGDVLYIADGGNDRVVSAQIGGGPLTELVTGIGNPTRLIAHGDTLYISDWAADRVVSAPIAGGAATELVTDLDGPRGLAVSGDTLYIADALNDRVVSAPITGGPVTELATGIDYPDSLVVGPAPCSGSSCLPVVGSLFGSLG